MHMPHWHEQIVAGTMSDIMIIPETGEEVYYHDLLVGINTLPPRQREAFELICLQGYTETAAAKVMLPNSRWSTTAQQHVNAALERMVARYDEHQSGVWKFLKKWRAVMSLHPIVEVHLKDALKAARSDLLAQMEPLKAALGQVDQMIKGEAPRPAAEPKPPLKVALAPLTTTVDTKVGLIKGEAAEPDQEAK
jgi:hypothetical protein